MSASYIPVGNYIIIINHMQLHSIPNNRAIQNVKAFLLQKMENTTVKRVKQKMETKRKLRAE